MELWCERAWLGGPAVEGGVLLHVAGDRITGVSAGVAPPPSVERLGGLTLPGLVNGHSHAFHRALRGRTHGGVGSFWAWREQMYRLAATLTPDVYLRLATATYGEMALAGITTVGEFHYLHHGPGGVPYEDANAMGEALAAAAAAAGLRMTLLDTCYLHGGIGVPVDDVQRRFSDGSPERWAERVDALAPSSLRWIGAAIHSVRAVAPAEMAAVVAWSARRGAPLHAHVSEQPAENEVCAAAYGRTPTAVLAGTGVMGERFTAVHATHLTDDDVALLGGSAVCFCPTTERDLADGIGPSAALAGAGTALCVGSDSHAVIDLFEEARGIELDERLATGDRGHHPADSLLRAATVHGAAALGWPEAGRLEVGALADLTVVATDGVRLAGAPPEGLVGAVVFSATAADVRHVMVAGRWIVRDGEHVSLPVPSLLASAIAEAWRG